MISTAIVGVGFWFAAGAIGANVSFAWALAFGALISLTDPVAVLSTLKEVQVPETLEIDMAGESLFHDGVGVVTFTVLLAAAVGEGGGLSALEIGEMLFVEALGGAALGLGAGFVSYRPCGRSTTTWSKSSSRSPSSRAPIRSRPSST